MKAQVDQNDIKSVFCMENWFLGFKIPLKRNTQRTEPF